jgi:hypothetical protein
MLAVRSTLRFPAAKVTSKVDNGLTPPLPWVSTLAAPVPIVAARSALCASDHEKCEPDVAAAPAQSCQPQCQWGSAPPAATPARRSHWGGCSSLRLPLPTDPTDLAHDPRCGSGSAELGDILSIIT